MRKNILIRLVVVVLGIILCLWGIWSAGAAGLSKLNSKYALVSRSLAPADSAVRLSDSDPEAHSSRALVLRNQRDWEGAVGEFERAAALRPRDYVLWYELALARDGAGKEEGALAACQQSVSLAPYYGRPRWLLGNLLFRAGRYEEAFNELRRAASSDAEFLPNMIDLAWGVSKGDAGAVFNLIQPENDAERIALAQYFARKGKYSEAVALFRATGAASEDERKRLLQALLIAHQFREAYEVWALGNRETDGESSTGINSLTDPGFERPIRLNETGFGWQQPAPLDNVRISVDVNNRRTGERSLFIEFNGNSNPGNSVISQTVLVEPGTLYNLRFAAQTEQLVTGGLPQISVSESDSAGNSKLLAAAPLPVETGSWRDYTLSFKTGTAAQVIIINLNRQGCTSGPCPAYGRVWLDDFSLQKKTGQ